MPNQEVMREWVRQLRSGERTQGKDRLRTGDSFCCLGVLCEIAVEQGVIPPPTVNMEKFARRVGDTIEIAELPAYEFAPAVPIDSLSWWYKAMPPLDVLNWAGISRQKCATTPGDLTVDRLAEMNDDGISFAEIADVIEATWIEPLPTPEYTVPDSPAAITEPEKVDA